MNKVSIVVPIYNMGNRIENCVESILKQTYENIEIILVDDGSKDNSLEVCNNLAKKDDRIKVYHTENRGSGPARNHGIENASGEYIYFPDADDYLEPNAIEVLEKDMREGGYDLIVFGFKNIAIDGTVRNIKDYPDMVLTGDEIRSDYYDYMTITSKYGIQGAPWNKFFNMRVIREYGVEYPPLRRHQDEGFIARYVDKVKNVHFIPDVFYVYYTNDLGREWDKYPVDYLQAVMGLNKTRQNTILAWNKEDKRTHDMVEREYICGVIKALELSFSPKMKLERKSRKEWIKNAIRESRIAERTVPENLKGSYQEKIMNIIIKEKYGKLYSTLRFKIFIQKNFFGLFNRIKKVMNR